MNSKLKTRSKGRAFLPAILLILSCITQQTNAGDDISSVSKALVPVSSDKCLVLAKKPNRLAALLRKIIGRGETKNKSSMVGEVVATKLGDGPYRQMDVGSVINSNARPVGFSIATDILDIKKNVLIPGEIYSFISKDKSEHIAGKFLGYDRANNLIIADEAGQQKRIFVEKLDLDSVRPGKGVKEMHFLGTDRTNRFIGIKLKGDSARGYLFEFNGFTGDGKIKVHFMSADVTSKGVGDLTDVPPTPLIESLEKGHIRNAFLISPLQIDKYAIFPTGSGKFGPFGPWKKLRAP